MTKERLQKALARAGVASRRGAEKLIAEGHVRINNKRVTEMGVQIDVTKDKVSVSGKHVQLFTEEQQDKAYFLLHKPGGVLTTTSDDRGRKTVMELIGTKDTPVRIYPVGRLDFDTEGALLLTNDGSLAHKLTHPKYHVPKTYLVKVKGVPDEDKLDKLRRGIYLDDGPTKPATVEVVRHTEANTWVEITVTEGRNRMVKRMFWRIRHPVLRLIRTEFAGLSVEKMGPGSFRVLTNKEVQSLLRYVK